MNLNIHHKVKSLSAILIQKGETICTAESCTGGLVAKTLTDLAGSSVWFDRGFVTYSNQSKIDMLGVNEHTLNKFGAVSEETAREMVVGALQHSCSQVALSITGVAGPGGGNEKKPVGTVCFGFALKQPSAKNKITLQTQWFDGDRAQVREESLLFAISYIESLIISGK